MRYRKTICAAVIASLTAVAIVGVFSARAEETPVHYFECLPRTNGLYNTDSCLVMGLPQIFERLGLSSTPAEIKSAGKSEFTIDVTILGVPTHIGCTTEAGVGTASNPEPFKTSSGVGKTKMTFEGCTVSKPSGCALTEKKIVTNELNMALEQSKTFGQGVKLSPVSGETFATLNMGAECPVGSKVVIKGSDFGRGEKEHEIEFIEASSSLVVNTNKVSLKGTMVQKDKEGNTVLIAP